MRPIVLKENIREQIRAFLIAEFNKYMDSYEFSADKGSFKFEKTVSMTPQEKIVIRFTPQAYLRCLQMVKDFSSEIGWYGLIEKVNSVTYRVYDIIVCDQKVSGSRVITDDEDVAKFYTELDPKKGKFMHFQAHSHVNMGTTPSSIDLENQKSTVMNMSGHGFYLFQIWNKNLDINSFLYDLDANLFYDRDDILVVVEDDEFDTMSEFINNAKDKVKTITYTTQASTKTPTPQSFEDFMQTYQEETGKTPALPSEKPQKKEEKAEEENKKDDRPWYWNDGQGQEGYD